MKDTKCLVMLEADARYGRITDALLAMLIMLAIKRGRR